MKSAGLSEKGFAGLIPRRQTARRLRVRLRKSRGRKGNESVREDSSWRGETAEGDEEARGKRTACVAARRE
jgi:hypothetical protein